MKAALFLAVLITSAFLLFRRSTPPALLPVEPSPTTGGIDRSEEAKLIEVELVDAEIGETREANPGIDKGTRVTMNRLPGNPSSSVIEHGAEVSLEFAERLARETMTVISEQERINRIAHFEKSLATPESMAERLGFTLHANDLSSLNKLRESYLPELRGLAGIAVDELAEAKRLEWDKSKVLVSTDANPLRHEPESPGPMSTYFNRRVGQYIFRMHVDSNEYPSMLLAVQNRNDALLRARTELLRSIQSLSANNK